jgi:hypothetical protein
MTLLKWGTDEQRKKWLPRWPKGNDRRLHDRTGRGRRDSIAEDRVPAQERQGRSNFKGQKKWISYGQMAALFLVFGKLKRSSSLAWFRKCRTEAEPIREMLGFRAADWHKSTFTMSKFPPPTLWASRFRSLAYCPIDLIRENHGLLRFRTCEDASKKAFPMRPPAKLRTEAWATSG